MADESVDSLMQRGYELVREQEYEQAIKVGRKLRKRRHTSAFEILALAYDGLGEKERAVRILEKGIERGPGVWVFWQLLGNYRSDLGLYPEAHEAYGRALSCPEVDDSSVHLNTAIALSREGRLEEAAAELELVTDPAFDARADGVRLSMFNDRGEFEEAIEFGEKLLARLPTDIDPIVRSSILTRLGEAYWLGRRDWRHARALAWEALRHTYACKAAMWLIREVEARRSPAASYYRMMAEGIWPETDEQGKELGFVMMADVVADDPEEALAYLRRWESEKLRESLFIIECESLEPRPLDPKGVYRLATPYVFPREEQSQ